MPAITAALVKRTGGLPWKSPTASGDAPRAHNERKKTLGRQGAGLRRGGVTHAPGAQPVATAKLLAANTKNSTSAAARRGPPSQGPFFAATAAPPEDRRLLGELGRDVPLDK